MRKLIKRTAGWIHTVLIMAIVFPLLCALALEQQDIAGRHLYGKCMLIILPVVLTDYAVEKCRSMLTYLVISVLIFMVTGIFGNFIGLSLPSMGMTAGYVGVLSVETILVMIGRLMGRLHKKEKEEAAQEAVSSWKPSRDNLREPDFPALLFFLAVYIAAQHVNNPAVCNMALFSAAVYAPVVFVFQYVTETEKYLSLNKRTCNLPSKRIYGIGNGMLLFFLFVLVMIIAISVFTINGRRYSDIRKWLRENQVDYGELESERQDVGGDPMEDLAGMLGEPKPVPFWVTLLTYALTGMVIIEAVLLVGALTIRAIQEQFRIFRETKDENGDIVEELRETQPPREKTAGTGLRRLSERERIRKQYRKTIRHYRKERPAAHETPAEIEERAGVSQIEEVRELHVRYETARYGEMR